ncbi:protein anon-37Cs [Diachasma alloeum]|uniref:protein anon-37Cs n=1 Tax=Diachasma alloeum TaxID=454923 RepID=UPI0007382C11|nr:protein anon-37Cs [Diachasma alloeum]
MRMSLKMWYLLFLLCITKVLSSDENPSVIIIGAGSAGIAAASKLLENGINDVTILEAQDRIGGRVYSTKMGEYVIDMGGQWVHGEEKNVVYEMAWPLGLLTHRNGPNDGSSFFNVGFQTLARTLGSEEDAALMMRNTWSSVQYFGSSGERVDGEIAQDITSYFFNITSEWPGVDDSKRESVGEYLDTKFNEYFDQHKDIPDNLKKPLMNILHQAQMAINGAEDLYQVSVKVERDYFEEGDRLINWKEKAYGTILDILMKKYPNPEEELPVMNKTLLNKKVLKIEAGVDGPVNVKTSDGNEYTADYVIFTPSLGVLKANHKSLFEPNLPPNKINAIENIGMGHVGKIYLFYDDPWWSSALDTFYRSILWFEDDKKALASDPERRWMLSVYSVNRIEWKPKVICLWMAGPNIKEMELLPEELVKNQSLWLLTKFFGKLYNLTEPSDMKRTQWNSNENFLGTYSYPSLDTEKHNATVLDLAKPVMCRNCSRPAIMFAGEATADIYGTVNGAIGSGWREAERIINSQKSIQSLKEGKKSKRFVNI